MTSRNMSITSLVLGIISVVCAWFGIGAVLGLVVGIVGLVFAVKGRKAFDSELQMNQAPAPNTKSFATAGLVLSIIGVVLSAIMFICAFCAICTIAGVASTAGFESLY